MGDRAKPFIGNQIENIDGATILVHSPGVPSIKSDMSQRVLLLIVGAAFNGVIPHMPARATFIGDGLVLAAILWNIGAELHRPSIRS